MPVACTECRAQHLRCDFKKPTCLRCADARLACVYLPSRRGGRRRPRAGHGRHEAEGLVMPNTTVHPHEDRLAPSPGPGHASAPEDSPQPPPVVPDARLVCLYYEHFHSAHPILLPPRLYEARNYPRYLQQVVKFIGSQYSAVLSSDALSEITALEMSSSVERTPCMVQALLLYSIILYARNEHHQAELSLSRAIDIALELGMYTGTQEAGHEAESLRRTWWELFIVEVHTAALTQSQPQLRCSQVPYNVPLPCEDAQYASPSQDAIPSPPSLESFGMRFFTDDSDSDNEDTTPAYSSYAYRIEAVRILARTLILNALPDPQAHPDHLQAVANAITSWTNHLPPYKATVMDMYGAIDEMLFQAHLTIHYAAMLLHLPRSNLRLGLNLLNSNSASDSSSAGASARASAICPILPTARPSPSLTRQVHDVMATEASKTLTSLLSVRTSARGYSPFTVSSLVVSGLVQLATSELHPPACADHHNNRVLLVLGCLKLLRSSWALGREAHRVLRRAAARTIGRAKGVGGSEKGLGSGGGSGSGTWLAATPTPANPLLMSPAVATPMFLGLAEFVDPTCGDPFLFERVSVFGGGELG
ncbi:putative Zn(II)2Cys6 transcription factor [Aspergillus mulundensis]|uniref:Putative Zn(II)2Cys6 transcription factor n=1 Tax=Aspergillus mulundensis TaxID=1810919 RepID=A0A3D8S4N2_9EURO|nr:putative Zn(II)2Cys6 transcription factor [Aspergillus mulundensis]RDW81252.1 putative Zn(II)2Cys6 transcription factor [Aspergillus mulundensis]